MRKMLLTDEMIDKIAENVSKDFMQIIDGITNLFGCDCGPDCKCGCQDKKKEKEVDVNFLSKLMNEHIQESVDKIEKKQKEMLVDSPRKVENLDVPNVISAYDLVDSLNESKQEVSENVTVKPRLINVNKTVETILTDIYETIKSSAKAGGITIDMLEKYRDLLDGVRVVTIGKVVDRVANHLSAQGYNISLSESIDNEDDFSEIDLTISW